MPHFLCRTCSTQFAESSAPPERCPICDDERQYVPASGQAWTTLEALARAHANTFRLLEPGLMAIRSVPAVGIDQRALLVMTPQGNILWDCIALLDDATEAIIRALGGLRAVALSHPHYYSTMVEWGRRFGVPVHLHAADREHVMRPDACLEFWDGEAKAIMPGVTLHRLGGHFAGGTVAHWADGAGGQGALLSGDILQVLPDRKFIGFMRSYPCLIPLPAAEVERMADRVLTLPFAAIYGAFHEREIRADGAGAVARSAARYRAWTDGMPVP